MTLPTTTREVGRRRLLDLAALLDTVPDDRFDFSVWVGGDWQGSADLSCGTTACALGWATTMPELRALGLEIAKVDDGHRLEAVVRIAGDEVAGELPWRAAVAVFGVTEDEAYYLFAPNAEPRHCDLDKAPDMTSGPRKVAEHIRKFVAWAEKHEGAA